MSTTDPSPGRGRPDRRVLEGRHGQLEPLDPARHGAAMFDALKGHDALWDFLPYGPFPDRDAFQAWLAAKAQPDDPLAYAVCRTDGAALGTVSAMSIRAADGSGEIGHILYAPPLQRTALATEAVYLIGRHLFENLGYRRYEWKCNDANEPSKRAALRFGFTPEGVFRQHMIVKGKNRDTAWFSIIDSEWPARKAAFEAWLDPSNFDADGRQRAALGC